MRIGEKSEKKEPCLYLIFLFESNLFLFTVNFIFLMLNFLNGNLLF